MSRTQLALFLSIAALLVVAGCGGDDDSGSAADGDPVAAGGTDGPAGDGSAGSVSDGAAGSGEGSGGLDVGEGGTIEGVLTRKKA